MNVLDTKVLGSPLKRRDASFMRMLQKDSSMAGDELENKRLEEMMNQKKRKYLQKKDRIMQVMEKDNVLNFIKDSYHSMIIMRKALSIQATPSKKDDAAKDS